MVTTDMVVILGAAGILRSRSPTVARRGGGRGGVGVVPPAGGVLLVAAGILGSGWRGVLRRGPGSRAPPVRVIVGWVSAAKPTDRLVGFAALTHLTRLVRVRRAGAAIDV